MPETSAPVAGTFISVTHRGLPKVISEIQSTLKTTRFVARVTLNADTGTFTVKSEAAIKAVTARRRTVKIHADYEGFDDNPLMRGSMENMLQRNVKLQRDQNELFKNSMQNAFKVGLEQRKQRAEAEDFVKRMLGNSIRMQFDRANTARLNAPAKAKRDAAEARRLAREEAKALSRSLDSASRPVRGASGRGANAFSQTMTIDADTSPAMRKGLMLRDQLNNLRAEAGVSLGLREYRKQYLQVFGQLKLLSKYSADPQVRLITGTSVEQMEAVATRLRMLPRYKQITIRVRDNLEKVNPKIQAMNRHLNSLVPNLVRWQKMTLLVLAATGPLAIAVSGLLNVIGGLVVGIQQAVGALGALPGLIALIAGVIGTLKLGFAGVADTVTAFRKSQEQAASSSNALRDAMEAESDALWAIDEQTRNHAKSVLSLQRQRDDASKSLRRSEMSIMQAESARRVGLRALRREQEDLNKALRDGALDRTEAEIALREAIIDGNQVAADRARSQLEDVDTRNTRNVEDKDDLDRDAPLRRAELENAVTDAYADQAEAVQQLKDIQADLLDAQRSNERQMMLNQRALRDAQEQVTKANQEARGASDEALASMRRLSPEAQKLVGVILQISEAWRQVKLDVQDALLNGAAGGLKSISDIYLPILREGLVGVADSLNGLGSELNFWLSTPASQSSIAFLFDKLAESFDHMRPLVRPVTDILLLLLTQSTKEMPGLIDRFGAILEMFDAFLRRATQDGSFSEWIQTGVTALGDALRLGWELLGLIGNIGGAMNQNGASPLAVMADGLRMLNEQIAIGTPGREALDMFFENIAIAAKMVFTPEFWDLVLQILSQFSDSLVTIAPTLSGFVNQFLEFYSTLQKSGAIETIMRTFFQFLEAIFEVLAKPETISSIKRMADQLQMIMVYLTTTAGGSAKSPLESLIDVILSVTPELIELWMKALIWALPLVTDALDYLNEHPEGVAAFIMFIQIVAAILPTVISGLTTLVGLFGSGVGEVIAFGAAISAIVGIFIAFWDDIVAFFEVHSPSKKFAWLGEMFVEGLLGGLGTLWSKFSEWCSRIWTDFKGFFGINSPSTLMETGGIHIVDGLMNGLRTLWGKLSTWLSGLPAQIASVGRGLWDGISNGFISMINTIISWWNRLDFSMDTPGWMKATPVLKDFVGPTIGIQTPDIDPITVQVKAQPMAYGGTMKAKPGGHLVVAAEDGADEQFERLRGGFTRGDHRMFANQDRMSDKIDDLGAALLKGISVDQSTKVDRVELTLDGLGDVKAMLQQLQEMLQITRAEAHHMLAMTGALSRQALMAQSGR